MIKPRIFRAFGRWFCCHMELAARMGCDGRTPLEAYDRWWVEYGAYRPIFWKAAEIKFHEGGPL